MGFPTDPKLPRRGFLQAGVGTALLCSIGGKTLVLDNASDADKADEAVRALRRPRAATATDPLDTMKFPTPQPQPGGVPREYWIEARTHTWDPAPLGRDEWHGTVIPKPRSFKALSYQLMAPGFAGAIGGPTIPGPMLTAEVGDTLVVHFRNGATDLGQAVTMHPHGVRYTPDYDGVYLGARTRAGGYIAPGEEFTYTWEATPDSVGAWPYHDHGPNHMLNTMRGLYGSIVIREKGAPVPDFERALFLGALSPAVTGRRRAFQCINHRTGAGNTPTLRAKVGQDVALHVFGIDDFFHDFHVHGHRWQRGGVPIDTETVGPAESITVRFREDNPGRWLYHCHVLAHQDGGMAGWYLVDP